MRYGMMIELDKCVGCKACVSACKERWDSGPGVSRDWVREFESGTREAGLDVTFYPGLCMHCDEHPCTEDCPTGATYADEHGVVKVDADLCIGCGNCVSRCPYGARRVDGSKGIVEKCNFCEPYVARGERPACVDACLAECRIFGDLDDPESDLALRIRETGARPLVGEGPNIGPRVYYSPAAEREKLLARGVVGESVAPRLTDVWRDVTRPAARFGVPAVAALIGAGGMLVNLRQRGKTETTRRSASEKGSLPALPRHRLGMRLLHWFNALSWIVLLFTGTALMVAPSFALVGSEWPRRIAGWVQGPANLLWIHVVWGLAWALIIVPVFLYFKGGGTEALREVRLTRRDLQWLLAKPRALLRLGDVTLPPQDKYNAGQKLFAMSALAGTSVIIATGVVMAFHVGPGWLVAAAVLLHKLAILFALVGLAVHVTMAVILVEERPALRSMITGSIDERHARHHNAAWVAELSAGISGTKGAQETSKTERKLDTEIG